MHDMLSLLYTRLEKVPFDPTMPALKPIHTHHHHRFRHHDYIHIKYVLIVALVLILVVGMSALMVWMYTKPTNDDE